MNFGSGSVLVREHLAADTSRELAKLDRLRDVWAEHRRPHPPDRPDEARHALIQRHARELRALAGHTATPVEQLRADEEALATTAADCRAVQELTPTYLHLLAQRFPGFDHPAPWSPEAGERIADAARIEAHPVVRAAHVFLACAAELAPAAPEQDRPGPPQHWRHPLPWALASLSLLRSNYPPLALDHRLASELHDAASGTDHTRRVSGLVPVLAGMEAAALRKELGCSVPGGKYRPPRTEPLAAAVHRRVQEHVTSRSGYLALVLRELDTTARVTSEAGSAEEAPENLRCDDAAARALVSRGPVCRWVSVDLTMADGTVRMLVAVQDVGTPATGVLAVTAGAWLATGGSETDILDLACTRCVTLIPTDTAGERWPEVERFVDTVVDTTADRLARLGL
ncbi:hypothetical protein [Haloactinospora alba]|uniref:hypothetical protein n=1 Tax=Haloactinospora alba TaxID=405555 RepID=UPI001153E1B8|nr:hypothetical protein [Haloactinospora alba]